MQAIQLLQIDHLELSGALGRRHRRRPQEDRCRYRQAHGRKISRSDEHPSSVQRRREKRALPRAPGLGGMLAARKYAQAGGSGGSWSEIATSAARFFGPLSFVPPAAGMHSCPIAAKHMRQKFCRSRSRERRKKAPTQSSAYSVIATPAATRRLVAQSQGLPRTAAIR